MKAEVVQVCKQGEVHLQVFLGDSGSFVLSVVVTNTLHHSTATAMGMQLGSLPSHLFCSSQILSAAKTAHKDSTT